jgi:hypothetical protein
MRTILFTLLLFGFCTTQAQDHLRAAGLRGGITSGLTYRQFLDPELAYEAILSGRLGGLQFTVLRQRFEPALMRIADDFFFTYGYGGHVGWTYADTYHFMFRDYYHSKRKFSPLIGMDGYLGLEYHFPTIPLQVGLDFKPFFELTLYELVRMSIWDVGFTLKYKF